MQNLIVTRCVTLGLTPSDAQAYAHLVSHLLATKGLEGGLAHLKKVGQAILAYHFSTFSPLGVGLKFDYPKCCFFLKKYPLDVQIRLAFGHRFVTFDKATRKQIKKFVSTATRPEPPSVAVQRLQRLIVAGSTFSSLPSYRERKAPNLGEWKSAHLSVEQLALQIRKHLNQCKNISWFTIPGIEDVIPTTSVLRHRLIGVSPTADSFVGNIGASQEPGGKLRVFASPFPVLQCALTPLFQYLQEVLRSLPQDCTFNQEKGAQIAAEYMAAGKLVYSVDLGDATNMFPLSPQLAWMRNRRLPDHMLNLFERVSRGEFRVPEHLVAAGFPPTVRWTVGQPLGTRPSFAAFSCSHNFLLRGLCLELGLDEFPFAILGDDLLIFDKRLYDAYLAIMSAVGVSISVEKSFISADFAEFAGYSIFSKPTPRELSVQFASPDDMSLVCSTSITDGRTIQMARAGKFRPFSMKGIRALLGLLGRNAVREAPNKERLFVEILSRLPSPYGGAGQDSPEDSGYTEIINKLKVVLDDPDFHGSMKYTDRLLGDHIAEAWSVVIGVRSYSNYHERGNLDRNLYYYGGNDAELSNLRVLLLALNPGYMRANRGYVNPSPEVVGKLITHYLDQKTSRALHIFCAHFEVPVDTPYYRLRILVDAAIQEACPAVVTRINECDDVTTIRRALKVLRKRETDVLVK